MEGILFLSVDDVITIHHNQIINYGGTLGVRDIALLQSAVAIPSSTFDGIYLHHNL